MGEITDRIYDFVSPRPVEDAISEQSISAVQSVPPFTKQYTEIISSSLWIVAKLTTCVTNLKAHSPFR